MTKHTTAFDDAKPLEANEKVEGFLGRLWNSLAKSREEQARTYVRSYLAQLGPSQLKELGFTADEIDDVRKDTHATPRSFWY